MPYFCNELDKHAFIVSDAVGKSNVRFFTFDLRFLRFRAKKAGVTGEKSRLDRRYAF